MSRIKRYNIYGLFPHGGLFLEKETSRNDSMGREFLMEVYLSRSDYFSLRL
jgi:hypothetical protein